MQTGLERTIIIKEALNNWKREKFSTEVLCSPSIFPTRPVYPSASWAEQTSVKDNDGGEGNIYVQPAGYDPFQQKRDS